MSSELEKTKNENSLAQVSESEFSAEGRPMQLTGAVDLGSTALATVQDDDQYALDDGKELKEQRLQAAEQWLNSHKSQFMEQAESIPVEIASEIALLAQKRMNILDEDDMAFEEYYELKSVRNAAVEVADELDFELVQLANDWQFKVQLDALHTKFKQVSTEQLSNYLGSDDKGYEYRAFRIYNIIASHAPTLLTGDLKVLADPTQPLWRTSSAYASILLRNSRQSEVDNIYVDRFPSSLPIGSRAEVFSDDEDPLEPVAGMSEDNLALYCKPEHISNVKQRGYALFGELTASARESLLARRIFEATSKSSNRQLMTLADERNRALEYESPLRQGDFVHATPSPEVLELILAHGIRCGEAILGSTTEARNYPFTVSFLEVGSEVAKQESITEKMKHLNNAGYGAINLIFHRDSSSTDYAKEQKPRVDQRQIFGGLPSTEIKSIIIRDEIASEEVVEKAKQAIINHGMFIPLFSGASGEPLMTSEQYDQLSMAQ